MNSSDSPMIRALLHARANHPTKSTLLQSLLAQLPNHKFDMQSTIVIDESLQVVLHLAAREPDVEYQLINDLLEQYGFALSFDPASTNTSHSEPDTDSTVDVPILSGTKKPIDQQRSTSGTPSLTHIINNSSTASVWVANDPISGSSNRTKGIRRRRHPTPKCRRITRFNFFEKLK